MTKKTNLRAFDHWLQGMSQTNPSVDWSWGFLNRVMAGFSGHVEAGSDPRRIQYDAMWIVKEALQSDENPFDFNVIEDALDNLVEYYEEKARTLCDEAESLDVSLNYAQGETKRRADIRHKPAEREKLNVSFDRLCSELPSLVKQREAQPFVADILRIDALKTQIKGCKAEYADIRTAIETFDEWRASTEYQHVADAYNIIRDDRLRQSAETLAFNRMIPRRRP